MKSITLNEKQISDLFFNFEKPYCEEVEEKYDHILDKDPEALEQYAEEYEEALKKDAQFFIDIIGSPLEFSLTWLVNDYNNRM